MNIPSEIVSLSDYERVAKQRISDAADAYFNSGAADEITLCENTSAYSRLKLQGRVLADLRDAHTRLELLGHTLDHPILLAPVAYQKLVHPDGERATALGAAATGTLQVVSTQASCTLEEIANVNPGRPWWFQLYVQPDRGFTRELIRRAETAGASAIVMTADSVVNGARNREWRAGFRLPQEVEAVNLRGAPPAAVKIPDSTSPVFGGLFQQAPPIGWEALEWLVGETHLPVLIKGVMHPQDAIEAVGRGVKGIIVSNHGGRNLDTLPATIEVLPRIADAVAGQVPVLMDGGIRRGTDVLKALALGAKAVLIGRPQVHGLAVAGASGVAHVVQILRGELEVAMALTGCARLADINRSVLF